MTPEELLADLNALCDGWVREYRFYPGRRCAFDYAHPGHLIAIEIEGGVWMSMHGGKSRHFHGSGAINDTKKYNRAEAMGWTIFHYCDNGNRIKKTTVEMILRDVKIVLTGRVEGQRTLDMTVQGKLLSEVVA